MFTSFSILRHLLLLLIMFGISFLGCTEKSAPTIIIEGSTTEIPILKTAAERYMQKNNVIIKIHCNGSISGIRDLTVKTCDMAASSSRISPQIASSAKAEGVDFKEFVIGHDMIAAIVHPSNPIKDLGLDQLKAVFDGSVSTWDTLGGKSEPILAVQRDADSGTREVWEKIVTKTHEIPENQVVLHSNSEVLAYVSKYPTSIGYVSLSYVNPEIKVLSINGVTPDLKNVAKGGYPIYRKLYIYVRGKEFSHEMKSFIVYLLSREGQEIVKESGFVPLNPLSVNS